MLKYSMVDWRNLCVKYSIGHANINTLGIGDLPTGTIWTWANAINVYK